ncbi:MAG: hypothetical protein ACFB00_12385 [Parvularculaceae bacterium]
MRLFGYRAEKRREPTEDAIVVALFLFSALTIWTLIPVVGLRNAIPHESELTTTTVDGYLVSIVRDPDAGRYDYLDELAIRVEEAGTGEAYYYRGRAGDFDAALAAFRAGAPAALRVPRFEGAPAAYAPDEWADTLIYGVKTGGYARDYAAVRKCLVRRSLLLYGGGAAFFASLVAYLILQLVRRAATSSHDVSSLQESPE